MDHIHIQDLQVKTQIGVHHWEQYIQQALLLNITLYLDLNNCNNDLNNTIDYDKLTKTVTHFLETNTFQLIETVAEAVVTLIREQFTAIKIIVAVTKPHAIKNAKGVTVSIER